MSPRVPFQLRSVGLPVGAGVGVGGVLAELLGLAAGLEAGGVLDATWWAGL